MTAGRPAIYDWDKAFEKKLPQIWQKGVDYDCETRSIVQGMRRAAYERGKKVSIFRFGDVICYEWKERKSTKDFRHRTKDQALFYVMKKRPELSDELDV